MISFDIKLLNFSILDSGEKNSYAIDVTTICHECGYHDIFGVAVSKEHGLDARERAKDYIKEMTGESIEEIREKAKKANT
jgi:poly(3-hydroxyalkanoate) synthetase